VLESTTVRETSVETSVLQRLPAVPDPINADPHALTAMSAQLIRQYDPMMTAYKTETEELHSGVFRTANQATLLVD
jgi:(S)-ureidoglycine-glyoxylate aminotransferase